MVVPSLVWPCFQAENLFDACRATSVAMVTLASCDNSSGSRNGWLIEWRKVNTLRGVTTARTIIALAPEGRQKIVVFATVVIQKSANSQLS